MVGDDGMGGNAEADLKWRVDRRIEKLDAVAELLGEIKDYKAEDKQDGFTEAAIMDAVKLKRADADKVLATLTLEAEKGVYRRAVGLPTDLATAQRNAAEEAGTVPESKSKRGRS